MDSKLSAGSIRFFLFADVLADLLQLEPDGGHRVTTGPEMLNREVSLLAAQSGCGYDGFRSRTGGAGTATLISDAQRQGNLKLNF
jgi:hypothetical protein